MTQWASLGHRTVSLYRKQTLESFLVCNSFFVLYSSKIGHCSSKVVLSNILTETNKTKMIFFIVVSIMFVSHFVTTNFVPFVVFIHFVPIITIFLAALNPHAANVIFAFSSLSAYLFCSCDIIYLPFYLKKSKCRNRFADRFFRIGV